MAVLATVLVGVVADGGFSESARSRIAALVVAAALISATIALLVTFHNAIAASLSFDGNNATIVGETSRLDAITAECRTNVAD